MSDCHNRDIQIIFDLAGYNSKKTWRWQYARVDRSEWCQICWLLLWILILNQLHLPILLMAVIQNPYLRPRTDQRDCYQELKLFMSRLDICIKPCAAAKKRIEECGWWRRIHLMQHVLTINQNSIQTFEELCISLEGISIIILYRNRYTSSERIINVVSRLFVFIL